MDCRYRPAGFIVERAFARRGKKGLSTEGLFVGLDSEFVAAVVLGVPAVARDPSVLHDMQSEQFVQANPEIDIGNRDELILFFPLPILPFPFWHPLANSFTHIDAVGKQLDVARTLEDREAFDDGLQFHPVVSRFGFVARPFGLFAGGNVPKDQAPATGSGIARACAVGEEMDFNWASHESCRG